MINPVKYIKQKYALDGENPGVLKGQIKLIQSSDEVILDKIYDQKY